MGDCQGMLIIPPKSCSEERNKCAEAGKWQSPWLRPRPTNKPFFPLRTPSSQTPWCRCLAGGCRQDPDLNFITYKTETGASQWLSRLRICCVTAAARVGHCCPVGSIPVPGTSACHGCRQNKERKNDISHIERHKNGTIMPLWRHSGKVMWSIFGNLY